VAANTNAHHPAFTGGAQTVELAYETVMIALANVREPIRVGILEDNPEFSDHLAAIVAADDGMVLAFRAETVADALSAFASEQPDLLLVDMQLPDGSGLDLVAVAAQHAGCRIMMLTVLADRDSVLTAFERGAHSYLLKDTPTDQIKQNIASVMTGESPVSPAAATHILGLFRRSPGPSANDKIRPTDRERDVLQMVSKGLSYAETAKALGLSVHTVGDHLKAIYRKLAVNSKSEAIFEARAQGWIKVFN
jgi:DNA-binding NarL/FixJ family response regulator